ncbi:MAG TPA: lipopolysaccharide heptosyltransferase I [Rhodocyclaceae bacterium]|nr:lipopolysaccharide heptosyltransferase I [Rhodocyclaceae bacterium]
MRILLVKTSSLGDVVHNLPVVSDIARHFPGAEIDWVVEESIVEIPRLHPAVRRVIPVAVRRWRKTPFSAATWREIGAFRRAIRADSYDAVLDSQGLLKSALIAAQARGQRIGHDRDSAREPFAARFHDRGITVPRNLHAVERNRLLAAQAFGYSADQALDYGIVAPPFSAGWLPAGDHAVLLTATSRADKEWPEDDWRGLGMALIATGLRCILPGGSPAERARAARLATSLGRAMAAPAMNLTELAGLLAGAKLVVGVDTGLVHLAAALGRPTLALYCGSDPALTGVLAGPQAINLGAPSAPPAAGAVVAKALQLLG